MAACEAIEAGRKSVEEMKREYKRRRELVLAELNNLGLDCIRPNGAFYCFASIKKTGLAALDFAERLLKEQKVAVVPGDAFGQKYTNYVRISYTCSMDNLKEALVRIGNFLKTSRRKK
jgi:aminotransferase